MVFVSISVQGELTSIQLEYGYEEVGRKPEDTQNYFQSGLAIYGSEMASRW
jgi:hypothetical protein